MGNTREEERDRAYRVVKDLPWSRREIQERLTDYREISDEAGRWALRVDAGRRDAYYQLVQYPVQAAGEMNKKML